MDVELLLDCHATIAESLTWHDGRLYWMDVKAPTLHRLDPGRGPDGVWRLPCDIGAFALMPGGRALVALRTGLHILTLADGALEQVSAPPFDPALHRFNEGAVDVAGRFWVGTMFDPLPGQSDQPRQPGTLSTWTAGTGLVLQPDAAELHNGMAWSPDGTQFYLSHSYQRRVFRFAFDAAAGQLGKRELFIATPGTAGIPDGAAVDEEGAYWCAMHGGGALHRYAPDGTLLRSIPLPVSQPTMVAFGGSDLKTMFVSSASDGLDREALAREPAAGGLFRLAPGVRGVPRHSTVR